MTKRVSILGSTGSIGASSLEVTDSLNSNGYNIRVVSLSANSRIDILSEQIKKYSPDYAVITDKNSFLKFKDTYNFPGTEILYGEEGLNEISGSDNYDLMITALVGFSGLKPTINAIKSGKDIALANKETMVVAGQLINRLTSSNKVNLFPIDSEHSALLQCITGEKKETVSKYILTASGGP
ncbi:MAG: 1-deoxy-D-xylulose-5-phosphate reductoisomerase, partial [Ignavibacteria bacterium]|nr:1-deoxy-D-xylulose-5-phosphate reductoisomerase [Ignavibacteria bacterium]